MRQKAENQKSFSPGQACEMLDGSNGWINRIVALIEDGKYDILILVTKGRGLISG